MKAAEKITNEIQYVDYWGGIESDVQPSIH